MMVVRVSLLVTLTTVFAGCAHQRSDVHVTCDDKTLAEQVFWLANSLNDHAFSVEEASAAASMAPDCIRELIEEAAIPRTALWHGHDVVKILPYPGGRHPRIGFLDGAVDPMRETKVSLFTPWDEHSYIVLDVPEAIFSNLGLLFLAHTHAPHPTVWDQQGLEVKRFEWDRLGDGTLSFECHLPDRIRFGTVVRPVVDGAEMMMWLHNGTDATLTELRTQVCIMFKGAEGFRAQTNENKSFEKQVGIAGHSMRDRSILTAWEPNHVVWANPPCPCLHSDPIFPDCPPGKTVYCHGAVIFCEDQEREQAMTQILARVDALKSWTHGD